MNLRRFFAPAKGVGAGAAMRFILIPSLPVGAFRFMRGALRVVLIRHSARIGVESMRKFLFTLHLWSGLILGLPLLLIGVTGTVLLLEPEIRGLTGPAASAGDPRPAGEILAAAKAVAPEGATPAIYMHPAHPGEAATVRFARQGGGFWSVRLDPVTLAVMEDPAGPFLLTMHRLHGNLLVQGREGRQLVGWLGVVMLVLGVTGLVLWWPRPGQWKAALSVKWRAKGIRFHRDLHGAFGFWGLAVFMVVSFSGVYLAFPQTIGDGVGTVLPLGDVKLGGPGVKAGPADGRTPLPVDEAVRIGLEAAGGGHLRSLGLPRKPDDPLRVGVVHDRGNPGAPAMTITLDPYTGGVLERRDPAAYPSGAKLLAWMRPLHEGEGLGLVWRVLVGLSGLLPVLFAITGTSLWWMKRRNRRAAEAKRGAALAAE